MRNRPAVDANPDARTAIDAVINRFGATRCASRQMPAFA
jgi:hypothetical protein